MGLMPDNWMRQPRWEPPRADYRCLNCTAEMTLLVESLLFMLFAVPCPTCTAQQHAGVMLTLDGPQVREDDRHAT